jgi:hypothetical protein
MYAKTLTVFWLATAVFANPRLAKRQTFNPSAISASIAALESQLLPPSNIAAELTGVPTAVQAAITNAAAFSSVEAAFESSIPAWFTSLPPNAQSYILNIGAEAATILPQISSLESLLPNPTSPPYSTGAITTSSHSNSTVSTISVPSTTSVKTTSTGTAITAGGSSASTTKKASTSSSSAGAATTGVGLGLAGAVGLVVLVL